MHNRQMHKLCALFLYITKSNMISALLTLYRIKLNVLTKVPLLSFTAIAADDLDKV